LVAIGKPVRHTFQQAKIAIIPGDHSIVACLRHIHIGAIHSALPVRGGLRIQRRADREVATFILYNTVILVSQTHDL